MPRGPTSRQAFRAEFQFGPKLWHLPASSAWLQRNVGFTHTHNRVWSGTWTLETRQTQHGVAPLQKALWSSDLQAKVSLTVARGVAPERRSVQTGIQGWSFVPATPPHSAIQLALTPVTCRPRQLRS